MEGGATHPTSVRTSEWPKDEDTAQHRDHGAKLGRRTLPPQKRDL
jgi:hypothetical protein